MNPLTNLLSAAMDAMSVAINAATPEAPLSLAKTRLGDNFLPAVCRLLERQVIDLVSKCSGMSISEVQAMLPGLVCEVTWDLVEAVGLVHGDPMAER